VCSRIRTQAVPEFAKTWSAVRAPSPPVPPVEDCVKDAFFACPIWSMVSICASATFSSVRNAYFRDSSPNGKEDNQQPEEAGPRMEHVHPSDEYSCGNASRSEFVASCSIDYEGESREDLGEMIDEPHAESWAVPLRAK